MSQLNQGEIYRTTYQGPYGHLYSGALNVILNVNFNEDGTGEIAEGSYYPTETVENCIADVAILPITDELLYTSNLSAGVSIPSTNILGYIPDENPDEVVAANGIPIGYATPLPNAGESAGAISLSQSSVFDYFPETPVQPTLCDSDNNCFDVILPNGELVEGGDPLPGTAGGFALKGDLPTIAPLENDNADLYLEWHAIDGVISESGLGDEIGVDEDGDGTDFDRIWALEALTATYLNSSCGFNYPVYGDVTDQLTALGYGDCIDRVDLATEGYVLDASFGDWGSFLTYNALAEIPADDSDHDYNGTDGRIIMDFDPFCIQDINVRHIMLEFKDISCVTGDLNGDGGWNVLDIVTLANCILSNNCSELEFGCAGDLNGDSFYNVLDIVTLANCILAQNCGGRVDDAASAELIKKDHNLSIEADGFIGGVQMTLTHSESFKIELTDRALYANSITEGTETRLIIVTPETDHLFSYSGDFEIEEVIVANSQDEVAVSLPVAMEYSLSQAYPNPFNPVTSMTLTLPVSGEISVEVYNLIGQSIATLAAGYMDAGSYTLTWDAAEVSSGMYFVKASAASFSQTNKLLLLK